MTILLNTAAFTILFVAFVVAATAVIGALTWLAENLPAVFVPIALALVYWAAKYLGVL